MNDTDTTTPPSILDALTIEAPPTTICHEDMPCWDCSTMGNMICGPTTTEVIAEVPPAPAMEALPRTGMEGSLALMGCTLILLGSALTRRFR